MKIDGKLRSALLGLMGVLDGTGMQQNEGASALITILKAAK